METDVYASQNAPIKGILKNSGLREDDETGSLLDRT